MQNKKKVRKFGVIFSLLALIVTSLPYQIIGLSVKSAEAAAVNLIVDGNFSQDINKSWFLWQGADSTRQYVLARGYEAPFGYGPYSLAVTATGGGVSTYDAGLSSIDLNRFMVSADKSYNLSFYVKATAPMNLALHLESAENYQSLTNEKEISVGTSWSKQQVILSPNSNGLASLVIAVGSLPDGATIYLDNISLFSHEASITTTKVSGYIGEKNKSILINNGNLFSVDEIRIELPYYDATTGTTTRKSFSPLNKNGSAFSFEMPAQTFSGVGKIFAGEQLLGQFDYQVMLKIKEVSPNPVLVDEDLVIYGTGFNPDKNQNFVIIKTIDAQGKSVEKWITPHMIGSELTQLVVKLPVGIVNGQLSVRSYYNNTAGTGIELKSNTLNYAIKPLIYNLEWSQPGYEQIGDKITITGKGIANHPVVRFYDESGKLISSSGAKLQTVNEAGGFETIEVVTPRQLNKLQVTVKVGNFESDKAEALDYTARPLLKSIQASKSRRLAGSNLPIPAAKPGDTIKLVGQGFKSASEAYVEFNGLNDEVVRIYVPADKIDINGNWISVEVPKGAQNGHVVVEINGQKSNPVPLEIIPNIISVTPLIPSPGQEMTFWTNGVGLDKEQATVHFQLANQSLLAVKPTELTVSEYGDVIVKVLAPKAISSDSSTIKLQYGYWTNDERYSLTADPYIERATMDTDTKILTIQGHGFSTETAGNQITYKYADGTVVSPKVRVLGVKTSNEGQEIKVQVLDDYYYGYVSVTVDGVTSNEVNIGPAVIVRIERRVQFVTAENRVMGVLYISGRNFGSSGDVKVGETWAKTHYRSNTFIIAVVEADQVNNNPITVTKAQ